MTIPVPVRLELIKPDDPAKIIEIVDAYVVDHPGLERTIARRLKSAAPTNSQC